jgi:DNA modification methylase
LEKLKPSVDVDSDVVITEGDVLEVLRTLPDNSFQLVVTSPPYNLGKEYEKKIRFQKYLDWQEEVIKELVRVTKIDGSIVYQSGNFVEQGEVFPLDTYFYPIFKQQGLALFPEEVVSFKGIKYPLLRLYPK